ncbi:MAG: ubiquinone/menaquinone biosynthesis methyltransferase [Gemmatimonadetes bacterium]|nr:ubiquinone/menaquinone biosynthesis methyltransferase [Gemmatimonadota bacterium]NIO32629.1 ubiquinone/menaquinone biosynthesis methyltransferase [Gemmatimonadota bacterium]
MASSPRHNLAPLEAESRGERAQAVRELFSAIAPRYDLLNHLLSLNIDRSWRRRAVDRLGWESRPDGRYLDVCAGTLDLAVELAQRPEFAGHVLAVDFSQPMLREGLPKVARMAVAPACADALRLPASSDSFDGAMAAFGVRNLADVDAGLRELKRALRPGARLVILDFAMPQRGPLRWLYRFYFTRLLPFAGRMISKHSYAYTYLPESVLRFAEPEELAALLRGAGFDDVQWKVLTGGIACVWWATATER